MNTPIIGTATLIVVSALPTLATADERNFGYITPFDVAGITSGDLLGSPINEVRYLNIGPGNAVSGFGWHVNITAFSPSWRSEMRVLITDSTGVGEISFSPGNDGSSGSFLYSTDGNILKLANYNLPSVSALADGLIRLEFFESFDDAPNTPDGVWKSGQLFFQTTLPSPGTTTLLSVLGLPLIRRRTR